MSIRMRSNKPYLLRAFYDWIVDSGCTPILAIDAMHPKCQVPLDYIEDGEIVFNISPSAIREMNITNTAVEFKASFTGVIHVVYAPIKSILALYAEENNEGIFFDADEVYDEEEEEVVLTAIQGSGGQESSDSGSSSSTSKKPFLKLVE